MFARGWDARRIMSTRHTVDFCTGGRARSTPRRKHIRTSSRRTAGPAMSSSCRGWWHCVPSGRGPRCRRRDAQLLLAARPPSHARPAAPVAAPRLGPRARQARRRVRRPRQGSPSAPSSAPRSDRLVAALKRRRPDALADAEADLARPTTLVRRLPPTGPGDYRVAHAGPRNDGPTVILVWVWVISTLLWSWAWITTTHVAQATGAGRRGRNWTAARASLGWLLASGLLVPAAAAAEPSAGASLAGFILLEEFLVLRDHVVVDRLPNQALRDEERVQLLLVERTQVDGILLVAVALYSQSGRPPADPGDGHALVARRAERRPKEALHLRQAVELSAGARDDVGRHLLRVRSGDE